MSIPLQPLRPIVGKWVPDGELEAHDGRANGYGWFSVNDERKFLVFISYFDALDVGYDKFSADLQPVSPNAPGSLYPRGTRINQHDPIALRSHLGYWMSANYGGGSTLDANRTMAWLGDLLS